MVERQCEPVGIDLMRAGLPLERPDQHIADQHRRHHQHQHALVRVSRPHRQPDRRTTPARTPRSSRSRGRLVPGRSCAGERRHRERFGRFGRDRLAHRRRDRHCRPTGSPASPPRRRPCPPAAPPAPPRRRARPPAAASPPPSAAPRAISASLTATPVASRRDSTSNVSGDTRCVCSASHAVGGGFGPTGSIQPASRLRRMSSQPSGSTTVIVASGSASAMPAASPPPPHGTTTWRRLAQPHRLHLRRRLDPGAALPLDDPRIVEARHQRRAARLAPAARAIFSRLSVARS